MKEILINTTSLLYSLCLYSICHMNFDGGKLSRQIIARLYGIPSVSQFWQKFICTIIICDTNSHSIFGLFEIHQDLKYAFLENKNSANFFSKIFCSENNPLYGIIGKTIHLLHAHTMHVKWFNN